jgi:hypothetical protein
MRKLRTTRPTLAFLDDLLYLATRLEADPQTNELAPAVRASRKLLVDSESALQTALEAETAALASRDHADDVLDGLVMDASRHALALFRTRDSVEYKNLFVRPPSEIVAEPTADEVKAARLLSKKLLETDASELRGLGDAIGSAAGTLETRQRELDETREPVALCRGRRDVIKEDVNLLRERVYGQLRALFPGDRARVEAFFRPTRTRRRADAAAETPESDDEPATDVS